MALGFEVPGGWHNEKDATAVTVLQVMQIPSSMLLPFYTFDLVGAVLRAFVMSFKWRLDPLTVSVGRWWLVFCWWPWERDAFSTL